jgi:hypothetical protein
LTASLLRRGGGRRGRRTRNHGGLLRLLLGGISRLVGFGSRDKGGREWVHGQLINLLLLSRTIRSGVRGTSRCACGCGLLRLWDDRFDERHRSRGHDTATKLSGVLCCEHLLLRSVGCRIPRGSEGHLTRNTGRRNRVDLLRMTLLMGGERSRHEALMVVVVMMMVMLVVVVVVLSELLLLNGLLSLVHLLLEQSLLLVLMVSRRLLRCLLLSEYLLLLLCKLLVARLLLLGLLSLLLSLLLVGLLLGLLLSLLGLLLLGLLLVLLLQGGKLSLGLWLLQQLVPLAIDVDVHGLTCTGLAGSLNNLWRCSLRETRLLGPGLRLLSLTRIREDVGHSVGPLDKLGSLLRRLSTCPSRRRGLRISSAGWQDLERPIGSHLDEAHLLWLLRVGLRQHRRLLGLADLSGKLGRVVWLLLLRGTLRRGRCGHCSLLLAQGMLLHGVERLSLAVHVLRASLLGRSRVRSVLAWSSTTSGLLRSGVRSSLLLLLLLGGVLLLGSVLLLEVELLLQLLLLELVLHLLLLELLLLSRRELLDSWVRQDAGGRQNSGSRKDTGLSHLHGALLASRGRCNLCCLTGLSLHLCELHGGGGLNELRLELIRIEDLWGRHRSLRLVRVGAGGSVLRNGCGQLECLQVLGLGLLLRL